MFSGITPPRLPRNTGTKALQKTGTKAYLKNWYQSSSEILVTRLFRKLVPWLKTELNTLSLTTSYIIILFTVFE